MSSRAQAAIGFREGNSIDIVRRSLPDDNIKREEREFICISQEGNAFLCMRSG